MTSSRWIVTATLAVLGFGWLVGSTSADEPGRKIAFVAGGPSHGYGAHEHFAGCRILAEGIEKGMPGWSTVVYRTGWPTDPAAFGDCAAVVI